MLSQKELNELWEIIDTFLVSSVLKRLSNNLPLAANDSEKVDIAGDVEITFGELRRAIHFLEREGANN